jgi:hypothetical protein
MIGNRQIIPLNFLQKKLGLNTKFELYTANQMNRLILLSSLHILLCFISCDNKKVAGTSINRNPIIEENKKRGTRDWIISVNKKTCPAPDHRFCRREAIEAYVSHASIEAGDTLEVFVSTKPASDYTIDFYRMGYYNGDGGRLVHSAGSLKGTPQAMPPIAKSNLLECKWQKGYELTTPQDWVSGVYLGKLTALRDSSQSYVIFIVKDKRKADFLFQCSDLTWQSYNRWPYWNSMYDEGAKPWINTYGAAIGFDRPYGLYVNELPSSFNPLSNGSGEFLLWEFPLAFWMEKQGYNVSYISNIDTDNNYEGLLRAKGFLSVGHDEYWTKQMVTNVSKARDEGVNILFLSGNSLHKEIYLKPSSDGRNDRILGRIADFENEQDLMGGASHGVGYSDFISKAPKHWIFEGTGMKVGDKIPHLIGWEFQGFPLKRDSTLVILAQGPLRENKFKLPEDITYASTIYTAPKGNFVFNAATCWWNMFLSYPPGSQNPNSDAIGYEIDFKNGDKRVKKMTENIFKKVIESNPR